MRRGEDLAVKGTGTTGVRNGDGPASEVREAVRLGARDMAVDWWWYLLAGIAWTGVGMFVLSYRPGSLVAVAGLTGGMFLFGGIGQLVVASRVDELRWLYVVSGILGVLAGIVTFAWPDITLFIVSIFVAWYLVVYGIVHVVTALAGAKHDWWWTQLLLGISELVLGVWAARSWERSLLTFVTLVGAWAIFYGVSEIFAAFALRDAGKRLERIVD